MISGWCSVAGRLTSGVKCHTRVHTRGCNMPSSRWTPSAILKRKKKLEVTDTNSNCELPVIDDDQPASSERKKPVGSTKKWRTTLNLFKTALEQVQNADSLLPGLGLASSLVLRIIKGIEVRVFTHHPIGGINTNSIKDSAQATDVWEELFERMERLSSFLIEFNTSEGRQSMKSSPSVARHLQKLNESVLYCIHY
jgi:hypothetical protein